VEIPKTAFEWRRPGTVLPVETFTHELAQKRHPFDPEKLSVLIENRMAGYLYQPSPNHIRNVIVSGEISAQDADYLHELLSQLGPWLLKHFLFFSGVTPRELANAMIVSQVTRRRVTIWMNQYSNAYDGYNPFEKWADAGSSPWS